jgi:hypothetical protein
VGEAAFEVISQSKRLSLALNLLPFAGIAFLWFIAVVRDPRLGPMEDRFFATVFLGSGLLYIAMTLTSAALAGGLIRILISSPEILQPTGAYALSRAQIYQTMNVYGIKMAGVFMFSISTILLRTGIVRRRIPFLGYVLGGSAFVEYWNYCMGSARVSGMGIPDEHCNSTQTTPPALPLRGHPRLTNSRNTRPVFLGYT